MFELTRKDLVLCFFKLVVGTFRDLMMSHDALELGSVWLVIVILTLNSQVEPCPICFFCYFGYGSLFITYS